MGTAVESVTPKQPRTVDDLSVEELAALADAYGHGYGADASSLAFALGGDDKTELRDELEAVSKSWTKFQAAWSRLRPTAREHLLARMASAQFTAEWWADFDPEGIDLSSGIQQLDTEAFGDALPGRDAIDPGYPALAHAAYRIWRLHGGDPELGRITNRKTPSPLYVFVGSVFLKFAAADARKHFGADAEKVAREQAGRVLTRLGRANLDRPFNSSSLDN